MLEILRESIPILGGIIGALVLVILIRESWRRLKRRRYERQRDACEALLRSIYDVTPEGLGAIALQMKKYFPPATVEAVLDEYREKELEKQKADLPTQAALKRKFANLYDHLGLIESYLKAMKESRAWTDRAAAAEKLGFIGHPSAVLPMIGVLQDSQEEREVKSVVMRALGKIRDTRAIPPLVEALGSPDPATGQPLADVLVQYGDEVVPTLVKVILESPSVPKRTWSGRILGILKSREAVPTLIAALGDHEETVRQAAAKSLGRIRDARSVLPLNNLLLMDPSSMVRETAAASLGEIGDEKAMDSLKHALGDMDYEARRRAMEAMEAIGKKAEPLFLEILERGDPNAQAQAAAALERLGFVDRAIVEMTAGGPQGSVSYNLLSVIAGTGVTESIIRSLNHSDFRVRFQLCQLLGEARAQRAFESLLDLAQKDPEWPVRLKALESLIALREENSLPVILRALREEDEMTRESLLGALTKLSQKTLITMVPDLIRFLNDSNLQVRLLAARLIGGIVSDSVIDPLLNSLKDATEEIRVIAALSLGRMGTLADKHPGGRERLGKALMAVLKDPDMEVRLAAAKSLGQLKYAEAIPLLAEAFEWSDEAQGDAIARSIAAMSHRDFFELIDQLMGLSHSKARAGIARTLGLLRDPKGLQLTTLFLKDREAIVRAAAARAVGDMQEGTVSPEGGSKHDMLSYLIDPSERVRAAAIDALAKIGDGAALDTLLRLLEVEPDPAVCRRAVLAVGCLAQDVVSLKSDAGRRIHRWMERAADEKSQAAGMVALVLWKDEEATLEILKMIQNQSQDSELREIIASLPKRVPPRFFQQLSLDQNLYLNSKDRNDSKTEEGTVSQGAVSQADVVKHYEGLLSSSREPSERRRAVQALLVLKSSSSRPAVESAFAEDPDADVRAQALLGLAEMLEETAFVEKIRMAVKDPSDRVHRLIPSLLKKLSPHKLKESRAPLVDLLDSPSEDIRQPISILLAQLYRDDWSSLADSLIATEKKSRILGLIETIARIGNPEAGRLLLNFLGHQDTAIRAFAARWASETGILPAKEFGVFLQDPQELVRAAAVKGMGHLLDEHSMDLLLPRIEDPSPMVRRELAAILGSTKLLSDARTSEALGRLTQDPGADVKIQALISLFRLGSLTLGGGTDLAKRFEEVIAEMDPQDKASLLLRLEKEGVLREIEHRLRHDRQVEIRREALQFLAVLDVARFAQEISASLQDPAAEIRLAAIGALAPLEDPDIQKGIEALSQDPVEEVRLAVKRRKLRQIK